MNISLDHPRYMRRAIMDVVSPGEEPEGTVTDSAEDSDEEPADHDWDKVDSDDVAESGTGKKD